MSSASSTSLVRRSIAIAQPTIRRDQTSRATARNRKGTLNVSISDTPVSSAGVPTEPGQLQLHASTNPLECINKEKKRRADVVGVVPDDAAIISLLGAKMLEINDERAVARRYMSQEALACVSHIDTVRLPAAFAGSVSSLAEYRRTHAMRRGTAAPPRHQQWAGGGRKWEDALKFNPPAIGSRRSLCGGANRGEPPRLPAALIAFRPQQIGISGKSRRDLCFRTTISIKRRFASRMRLRSQGSSVSAPREDSESVCRTSAVSDARLWNADTRQTIAATDRIAG